MLLAVDVGNTQTVIGVFDGDRLTRDWRVATEAERTADEIAALVDRLLELADLDFEQIDGVCLSSTVPVLVREYEAFAERYARRRSSSSARASRRGYRSCTTIRTSSGPTGS